MDILIGQFTNLWEYLLFHQKSTTAMAVLLLIVIAIAFFVNRKRDASGRVSFTDKSRTGVIGVRIYETEEGYRKRNWLIPLWMPESNLLLNVRMLLPKGEYDIKAYWKADVRQESVFEPQPLAKVKAHSLSGVGKFKIAQDTLIEFRIGVSEKKMRIDSPSASALESDPAKPPFPLIISDPSIGKVVTRFEKAAKSRIWELSVADERVAKRSENEIRGMRHKLEKVMMKNKELKANLDQLMEKLKAFQKSRKASKSKG